MAKRSKAKQRGTVKNVFTSMIVRLLIVLAFLVDLKVSPLDIRQLCNATLPLLWPYEAEKISFGNINKQILCKHNH